MEGGHFFDFPESRRLVKELSVNFEQPLPEPRRIDTQDVENELLEKSPRQSILRMCKQGPGKKSSTRRGTGQKFIAACPRSSTTTSTSQRKGCRKRAP